MTAGVRRYGLPVAPGGTVLVQSHEGMVEGDAGTWIGVTDDLADDEDPLL